MAEEACIADIVEKRAALTPDRVAITFWEDGSSITYKELEEKSGALSQLLLNENLKKGDRVSILGRNSLLHIYLFFACSKTGLIFTPINHRLSPKEIKEILEDAKPKIVLIEEGFEEGVENYDIKRLMFKEVERYLTENRVTFESTEISLSTPHTIFYTSGTTGKPKGAVLSNRMILWNSFNTIVSWGIGETDVTPVLTPLFHSGGFNVLLVPTLHAGGRVILTRSFDPDETLRMVEKERVTILFGVPTMFKMITESEMFYRTDLSCLRFCISGGAPCPEKIIKTFWERGIPFRQGYGLTEAGVNCFSITNEDARRKIGSAGKPIMHMRARIVDENGKDADEGELILSGPNIMDGYWEKPEETRKVLKDGWLYTGDIARVDGEGFFYIVGRKKEMFITGGENVYFAEVENVIIQHPKVEDVAVIPVPDEKWGEVGRAVVVCKKGQFITEKEIVEFCKGKLATYKIPKSVVFTDSIPRNPYGKIIRRKLIDKFGHQR